MSFTVTRPRPSTNNYSFPWPDVFCTDWSDQSVMSALAANHLAPHQRQTYYYQVGVTSLCQSQSAGLAFLNSSGWQLLVISLTTFLKKPAGAFPSLTIIKKILSLCAHIHTLREKSPTHTPPYTVIQYSLIQECFVKLFVIVLGTVEC